MFFLKAWAWLKKYWGIVALVVGAIIGAFMFRKQETSFADQMKKIQDAHAAEMKQINDARLEEERQHAANEKQLQVALVAVQVQYDAAMKDLDAKKKAQVADIVKQYGDDPVALAKKLSEATGFTIVLPSQ
jgi:uncharacterized membrane-anchored protein YhcB (DUF1043 family)